MAMTIVESRSVTGGVDTHLDTHAAAVVDPNGGLLEVAQFPATPAGYQALHDWMGGFGAIGRVGVEGTGAYGAGLARYLRTHGVEVVEVDRPNRQARRRHGKSDPLDAVEAARAALSGRAHAVPKTADSHVEAIRALLVARRSARSARIAVLAQMRHLVVTAPADLRTQLKDASKVRLVEQAAALRPGAGDDTVAQATKFALGLLGRRVANLQDDIAELDTRLADHVTAAAPELLAVFGVGVHTAALLLAAVGDNGGRIRSEAAFAKLCGVAPLAASSGKITRHRLNRGGNREANHALWRIAMVRMSNDPRTRAYVTRKLDQGRRKPEILRLLKRYIAREIFPKLPTRN
jgi:transposase